MYTIIGADGREYGPVPAEKVREWITGGRANNQTRIKVAGTTEWTTIGALPEFGATPAASAPAAPPLPAAVSAPGGIDASDLIARAAPLDIGNCFSRGWRTGRAHFFPLLGVTLLISLCACVLGMIPFANLLFSGVLYGGLYFYALKKTRGQATEVGDAFSGFSTCLGQLILATLVSTLLTIVAFLCLILPGIYVAVAWIFTYLIVREKGLQFWDAMELGRRVVTAQWFRVFGLLLLFGLLALLVLAAPIGLVIAGAVAADSAEGAGVALIGVGTLAIIVLSLAMVPFYLATLMHAYDDLFNPPPRAA